MIHECSPFNNEAAVKHILSDFERILLANQFEMLFLQNGDISCRDVSRQLLDGHSWLYEQSLHLNPRPIMSYERSKFVIDVMKMFDEMQKTTQTNTSFPGFDGNNEPDEYAFSNALNDAGRFSHVKGIGDNSHGGTLIRYSKMLHYWRSLGGGSISNADVTSLLNMSNYFDV